MRVCERAPLPSPPLPPCVQSQWSLTAGFSSILTGVIVVPGAAGGALFGGWLIKRLKLSARAISVMLVVSSVIATGLMFSLLLHCRSPDVVGISVPCVPTPVPPAPSA